METIKIQLVRSTIRRPQKQVRTLQALGLKMNAVVEHEATPRYWEWLRQLNIW